MKAAVNTRYGSPDVVEIREVPKPEPGPRDVLVKVHASTVSRTDCGYLRAHPFFMRALTGLRRPARTILGMDFAGEVEEAGAEVRSFAPGDRVFGLTPHDHGGHAEYLCVPEEGALAAMPAGLGFAEAVVCEGALYANTNLEAFGLQPGNTILIYGASGAIGTAAVQLAKSYGAEVTAVAATKHLELIRSLGADHLVDYTAQDFTQLDEEFDFILDAVGKASYFRCRRLLKPGGSFAATDLGPRNQNLFLLIWSGIRRNKRIVFPIPKNTKEIVQLMKASLEAGEFRAVIDRRYPLEQIRDAYLYVETGQKTGIVVVDVGGVPADAAGDAAAARADATPGAAGGAPGVPAGAETGESPAPLR
jgi:NADPH:quinone reductase-like Zn-dependent oxidoreductase